METTTREDKYFPLGLGRIVERVVARDDVGRVPVEGVLQVLQLDARLAMVTPQLGLVHPETYDSSTAKAVKTD